MSDRTDDERTGLLIVLALAGLAGAVDSCGFFLLKDLYVSFMSGNTTSMAAAFARGDWPRVWLIAGILTCFVLGTACGTVIGVAAGHRRIPVVILSVAAMLVVPVAAPGWRIAAMTFAMGMLNAALHAAGAVEVSVTYVTGTLARFGKGIGLLLCGRAKDWGWLHQTVPWLGLVAGAALGTAALLQVGLATLAALPAAALLIAAAAWLALPRA
jgi:uncharacterized membrane protein YoaK (UPF0700 family)